MANLTLPQRSVIRKNPYLNKRQKKEPYIDLHTLDLMSISQITPELFNKYSNHYESVLRKEESTIALQTV